jgi:4-hydroxybenzoate polyprenyltransferase
VPNYWPLGLSFPVLVFLAAYSYTKRITSFAHFWLGASLLLAPLAAWIAIRGPYQLVSPLLLGGAVMFWVAGFDILYATQDAEFDRVSKLHSIPARFGVARSLRIAAACHIVMWLLLAMLTYASPHLGAIFASGLIVLAAMLIYQHVLVRPDDLTRVNRAFFQVNAVISIGMLVLAIAQLWIGN